MKRPWSIALPFGLAILLGAGTASATFTNLYVFGDSLSDSGNLFALTGGTLPPSPPYAGKMSNGPVAVEYLAANLGLPIAPAGIPHVPGYDLGGNNFALVGAATGMVPTRFVAGGPYDNYAAFSDNYPPSADALNGISGIEKQVLGFGVGAGLNLSSFSRSERACSS
jgi:phospholipase/lecithinase/hemolysin